MSIRILVPIGVLALTLCCESVQAQSPGTPLSSSAASTQLQGKTGSIRSSAIAQVAPFLKADLTAQETADILGTASELSEAARANAILSIARAKKLGALGAEAALMLKATTGNNRSMAISEIAPYLKIGLTGQETADILGAASELSEAARANAILSIARAKKLGPLGAEAALMLKGATGNNRSMAIAEIAPYLKIGLTGQETADILGTANELSEAARANAILSIARAKELGPLGAEAALMLKGATGNNRSMAIAEIAPYLKVGLTGLETADILGAVSELSEAPRANAILSIARAKKLGALGAEAALMLKGATGNNRSMAIAEIAPYLKVGLTGQETADILGAASELSEAARANAILSIARAKKLGPLGAEAALMLKGATGNNRSMAIAEIAPYLKIGLTGRETADILGTASELSEAARANAIQSIARAGKTMPGLSEGELAPVLVGMTGSNRALALSELRVSASPSAASVGGIAALPPSPQTPPPIQTPRSAEATSPSPPQSPSAGAPIPSSSSASATSPPQSATAGTTPSVINPVPGELPKLPIDQLRLAEYAYQFGLLSQSVYNVDPVSSVTVPTRGGTESWERVGVPLIRASGNLSQDWGFRAGVYLNKKGTADQRRWRCAVVFAGSEKGIDWLANINQFLVGPMPEQYRMSTEFARSALDGPCKGIQTILAGHSLGGGLAQYVYAQTGEKHITFTFNPAGLGYGRLEFRGVNWRAGKVISFVAHSFDPSSGKVIGRDVVSMTGVTLGREILVPVYSRWPYPHLIEVLVEGLGLQRDYCLHDARCR